MSSPRMTWFTFAIVTICNLVVSAAQAPGLSLRHRPDLVEPVAERVDEMITGLVATYKEIHASPELSLAESVTATRIAAKLREIGYGVTTGIGGHGVVGILSNGVGPTLLIRCDLDALPVTEETGLPYASKVVVQREDGSHVGVMHACGHDIHQAVMIGTAEILHDLKDQWRGTLVLIGQPAEEVGKGARMMIGDGLFDRFPKPDYAVSLHVSADLPAGSISYRPGRAFANVDTVEIVIHGRGGHGSRPEETEDPIVAAAAIVMNLQTLVSRRISPIDPAVVTVGAIHAGTKANIIPNTAKLQITVRSFTSEVRQQLLDGIRQLATDTAKAMGCSRPPDVILKDEFTPACFNDEDLATGAARVFRELLGEEFVTLGHQHMGGEDFGQYARTLKIPGFMYRLGSVNREQYEASRAPGGTALPPIHSSTYAPDPEPTIRTGVKSMCALALSLLDRP